MVNLFHPFQFELNYHSFMKSIVVLILFIVFSIPGYSQIVKFIKNPVQAKFRVYITTKRNEANQWVYKVSNLADIRKPGHWFVVSNPQLFSKAMTLYKVDNSKDADLIVYFVSTSDSARIISQ